MATESIHRLRREILVIAALQRLMAGEVARISQDIGRRESREWDGGDAAIVGEGEIAGVRALQEKLRQAHQELLFELEAAEQFETSLGQSPDTFEESA